MNIINKYNIDIEKILLKLKKENGETFYNKGDYYIANKNQFQVKCPFHNDKSPSMGINKDLNAYHCFVCRSREEKINGNDVKIGRGTFISQFIKLFLKIHNKKEISNLELFKFLEIDNSFSFKDFEKDLEQKPIFNNKINGIKENKVSEEDKKIKISELDKYQIDNNYYFEQRFNNHNEFSISELKEAINFFLIGFDNDKKILTIPIFFNHYLVGIYGRFENLFNGLRYISIIPFKKSNHIFNIDEIDKNQEVILVEGPLNAIKLWMCGYKNVISLFSALPYYGQIQKLKEIKNIKVWFDDDEAGQNGMKELKEKLKNNNFTFILSEKDALDLTKEEITNLLKNGK